MMERTGHPETTQAAVASVDTCPFRLQTKRRRALVSAASCTCGDLVSMCGGIPAQAVPLVVCFAASLEALPQLLQRRRTALLDCAFMGVTTTVDEAQLSTVSSRVAGKQRPTGEQSSIGRSSGTQK
jgi:hypothetical protein